MMLKALTYIVTLSLFSWPLSALGADKLTGIHSARVMSQSMSWIAQVAGLFKGAPSSMGHLAPAKRERRHRKERCGLLGSDAYGCTRRSVCIEEISALVPAR